MNLHKDKKLNHCKYLDFIASNCRMNDERMTGRDLERSGSGLIEILSQHLRGRAEETHGKPQSV
jgi:hypothetical protein